MRRAVFAGSFDPFTNGHLDIIKKASRMFDQVMVVLAYNPKKKRRYHPDVMCTIMDETIKNEGITNVVVGSWTNTMMAFMTNCQDAFYIRGLRGIEDYLYEEKDAKINKEFLPSVEYIYLRSDNEIISSTMVKELFDFDLDISSYVPEGVLNLMKEEKESLVIGGN